VSVPKNNVASIVAADTTTKKVLYAGGANGSKVTVLTLATDDSAAQNMQVWVKRGGVYSLLGTVPIAALSGGGGTVAAVDLLGASWLPGLAMDNDGQHYILLQSSDTLEVSALATVTAAKTHYLWCMGGDL
jgi:hypothetical protein